MERRADGRDQERRLSLLLSASTFFLHHAHSFLRPPVTPLHPLAHALVHVGTRRPTFGSVTSST